MALSVGMIVALAIREQCAQTTPVVKPTPVEYREAAIAVGPPVTQRPPHRSRRAVFPHRALQPYSLPHSSSSHRRCRSRLSMPHNPWPLNLEVHQERLEPLPVIAGPLAPPIEPLQESTYHAVEELLETRAVPVHSVVVVIPPELGVQPRK